MFLVDTNFLGTAETLYPEDVFPTFWRELERTLFTGDVFFHSSVDTELKKWSHPRLNWYLKNVDQPKQILHPDGDEINAYREVTEWADNHPTYNHSAATTFLNAADSWLVASGARYGYTIVSNEKPAPNSVSKIKIPDAADAFQVECVTLLEFLRIRRIKV